METRPQTSTRKKFLIWSVITLGSATVMRFLKGSKTKKTETVKMLTQDGKLVEIDKRLLNTTGKKITNEELQQWITHKTQQH